MKTETEVREKFDEIYRRKIEEFAQTRLKRCYSNCTFNFSLKVKNVGKVCFCRNEILTKDQDGVPLVCNDDVMCGRCGHYQNKNTTNSICEEFLSILRSPSRCGEEFPKLAVLIWFLQDTKGEDRGCSRFCRFMNHIKRIKLEMVKVLTLQWL